ncbi:hypothetical protein HFP71_25230 [Streptomyces sp. ARC32]
MLGEHLGVQIEDLRLAGVTVLVVMGAAVAVLGAVDVVGVVGVCWCARVMASP